ncbi:MAG: glycosyltransferase family 9 protein [Deltaproteobacteria bacterium]|nr:glycosyltransferase family 9 protein [Deltaproteobacteria bacterium]
MIDAKLDLSPDAVRSILIHKPDHLGDVLCAAPAIRALREHFPNARFVASVMAGPAVFLTALGLADEIFALRGPDWWAQYDAARHIARCRAMRFDLVVNFRHDVRDILAVGLMGARRVCSSTHRGIGSWFRYPSPPPQAERAEIENHLAMLRSMDVVAHFAPDGFRSRIPIATIEHLHTDGHWIVFHPFSRTRAKAWSIEHACAFVRLVISHGVGVRLIGANEHARDAEAIWIDSPRFVSHVGQTDAVGLMACVAAADALVCSDSGPGHIAPLVGTPVVTIASGTNEPSRWAPLGATVVRNEVPCAPCHLETCPVPGHPCLNDLTPAAVFAALSRVLGFA